MTATCAFCNQLFTAQEAAELCVMQFTHLSESHKTEFEQTCGAAGRFNLAFSSWAMLSRNLTSADPDFQRARDGHRRQLLEMIGAARTTGPANGGSGQEPEGALLEKW